MSPPDILSESEFGVLGHTIACVDCFLSCEQFISNFIAQNYPAAQAFGSVWGNSGEHAFDGFQFCPTKNLVNSRCFHWTHTAPFDETVTLAWIMFYDKFFCGFLFVVVMSYGFGRFQIKSNSNAINVVKFNSQIWHITLLPNFHVILYKIEFRKKKFPWKCLVINELLPIQLNCAKFLDYVF